MCQTLLSLQLFVLGPQRNDQIQRLFVLGLQRDDLRFKLFDPPKICGSMFGLTSQAVPTPSASLRTKNGCVPHTPKTSRTPLLCA
jgi:hypothetical protein